MTPVDAAKMSKRQRRSQGSNPSTTWQQQPRIKSASSRARAYITYAGLNDDDADIDDGSKNNKKAQKTNVEEMLDPQLDLNSPEVKFGRMLGGTDQRARHKAVKMLRHYLRQRADIATGAGISELDLMKLWKAMWYTLYMADKVPVQDKLSQVLAELMWCLAGTEEEDEYAGQVYMQMEGGEDGFFEDEDGDVMWTEIVDNDSDDDEVENEDDEDGNHDAWEDMHSGDNGKDDIEAEDANEFEGDDDEEGERLESIKEPHCRGAHLATLYVLTFLRTVKREWGNVDKHRVDKFYTAVRFMIREVYKYMAKRHWNLGIIRLFNDVIYEEALSHESAGLTNGLRFHLIDICIEELAQANAIAEIPLTEATFLDCVEPFFALAQKAKDKNVHTRVMDKVLLRFLFEYSFVATPTDEDEYTAALIFSQVHVGSVAKFIFEIASDNDTDERFRKALYEMYKTYQRQIQAAGRDVDLSHIEEADSEEDCCANNTCSLDEDGQCNKMMKDNAANVETPVETKSSKKMKKKRNKTLKENDEKEIQKKDTEVTTPKTTTTTTTTTTSSSSSSKKKNKKKDKNDEENVTSEDITAQYDGRALKTSSKKKQSNNELRPTRKKRRSSSVDPHSMSSPDQVISPPSSDADDTPTGTPKRVSFGKMNHCKSYKASMKAIKTLNKERWDTKSRTPEKGILNKTPIKSKSTEKSSIKKKRISLK